MVDGIVLILLAVLSGVGVGPLASSPVPDGMGTRSARCYVGLALQTSCATLALALHWVHMGLLSFAWHIFIVVWSTGCVVFAVRTYRNTDTQRLSRQVERQVMQTRMAELQARERKALDAQH